MQLSNSDLKRYFKQIILKNIGVSGQKKIASSKILVIGVGGLGCPLLLYLANSGVKNFGIVDNDKIELSNLNRQILFTKADLGKYKVSQAEKILKRIDKNINIKSYKKKVDVDNIKSIIKNYDIICDGTDNFKSRYLINDYSLKFKKILISAAINKFNGHLFKFDFRKKTPCFRCFMPEYPNSENNCETDGIISPLAGVMGTLQANEVLKSILNIKSDSSKSILIFDSMKTTFRKVKLNKNPSCVNQC